MKVKLHQTHHAVGDFKELAKYLQDALEKSADDTLHVFSELYLTGYPLRDLCLQRIFIRDYLNALDTLDTWSSGRPLAPRVGALLGGLQYTFDRDGLPETIENVAFFLTPGRPLEKVYSKILLPNYDIFDEKKYFTAGKEAGLWTFQARRWPC